LIFKYILAWIGMVVIAVLNGTLREWGYKPFVGELVAHQISTVTAILLFGIYIWLLTGIWTLESTKQALTVGLIWLGLTIAFEFLFGHYIAGHSWSRLLTDYNIFAGRIWVLVLIWIAVAPMLMRNLRS
jgi:hypothetical protein